jgi:hypothetical protein
VLRANLKWKLVSQLVGACLALSISIGITSCERSIDSKSDLVANNSSALTTTDGPLSEVNIPASISKLAPSLEKFHPQVRIISPKPDETLSDDRVTVKLDVQDLPLFKQPELGLGNHLHVILDKQTYQGVYDLSQPLVFKNLAAGTHSLRVFASRPWHESFKNEGAYAQVSFNVLTKTAENNPNPQQPLLTYSRPAGTYGAEPIMLDYYLTNAPSHLVANGSQESLPDWRIRVTVNEQRFILDKWAPVYLQGFKQGKNWVRLELVDDQGNPMPNVYNDSLSIVTYDPQSKDTLAKLVRGNLDPSLARTLVDPNYVAIKPAPSLIPTPVVAPVPVITPTPAPTPVTIPVPIVPSPSPIVIVPVPIIKPIPTPIFETTPTPTPTPTPEAVTAIKPIIEPPVAPAPIPTPVIPNPAPEIPVAKAVPAEIPVPEAVKTPIVTTPQPVPVITPKPAPIVAPVPTAVPEVAAEKGVVIDKTPSSPSLQPQSPQSEKQVESKPIKNIEPSPVPTPVAASAPEKTLQTQALDLAHIAGVKIRAFTNTIPSKAQRFGHNVQILAGKAINQIQAWRAAHVD